MIAAGAGFVRNALPPKYSSDPWPEIITLSSASLHTVNSCRSYDIVNGSLTFVAKMNSRKVSSILSSDILH